MLEEHELLTSIVGIHNCYGCHHYYQERYDAFFSSLYLRLGGRSKPKRGHYICVWQILHWQGFQNEQNRVALIEKRLGKISEQAEKHMKK